MSEKIKYNHLNSMFLTGIRKMTFLIFLIPVVAFSQEWVEIIDGKTFENGLVLAHKNNVLIKKCHIVNPNGKYGLEIQNCKNVRVEKCIVRHVGNESVNGYIRDSVLPKDSADYPQKRGGFNCIGIVSNNSFNVVIFDSEVSDVFGQGIAIKGDDYKSTGDVIIEKCRIAYIYSDGIKFSVSGDQKPVNGEVPLPFKGGIIRDNVIHDIGLGTSQLSYARHGMYLKARDILVENNTIYNCFYGQGVSLRNAGIIRNNKIWNCLNSCISYWAQTNTKGSSKKVVIEGNQCRQNYLMDFRMRHVYRLERESGGAGAPVINCAYAKESAPYALISEYIIKGNTIIVNQDYLGESALIGGHGEPNKKQNFRIEENTLIDLRKKKNYYSNLPYELEMNNN